MTPCQHGLQINASECWAGSYRRRELSPAELVRTAEIIELDAWKKFGVCEPRRDCNISNQVARTRWVLTWEMAGGRKSVKALLVAKGYQYPDIQEGVAETSGCVHLQSSRLRVISLCARQKWKLRRLEIENASLQAGASAREKFPQKPSAWGPLRSDRVWKLKAPAYGLHDAPVAFRRSLKKHLSNSDASLNRAGLRRTSSTLDPRLSCISGRQRVRRVNLPPALLILLDVENQMF